MRVKNCRSFTQFCIGRMGLVRGHWLPSRCARSQFHRNQGQWRNLHKPNSPVSPCAHGRKVVQNLQSDPWHVTEIGRAFEELEREEKRESVEGKTVELGGFVFCLGLPALIFLLFLEQRCPLKNRRASILRFSSAQLSISTFSPPYSKA